MIERINNYSSTMMMSTAPPVLPVSDSNDDSFAVTLSNTVNYGKNDTLICSDELEEIFQQAADTYQVPVSLLKAVAKAESDFNPNCVSSAGAVGIMQLTPETARELGVTNLYDPEQNIMGGAKELAGNLEYYNGDVSLALAAYNAGRGAVKKYGGIPPYTETQNYVKKVLAYMNEDINVPDITTSDTTTTTTSTKKQTQCKVDALSAEEELALERLMSSAYTCIVSKLNTP